MNSAEMTRREGLGLAALMAGAVSTQAVSSQGAPRFATTVDFLDPIWNRDTFARMDGDLDPSKEKIGWVRGTAYGVRPNEPVRPLFVMDGFSFVRTLTLPDGNYRRLCREIGFYRNLETGEIMDSWRNPYTNEDVRVVGYANDPFNWTISDTVPEAPSYGGLQRVERVNKPFLMPWRDGPNGTLICQTGIDMMYPSALQPDRWPRESAGEFSRVSEHFIYVIKRADAENPALTKLPLTGTWARIGPWTPWMLMGQAEGNINFLANFMTLDSISQLPPDLVAAARAKGDKWFHAPDRDYGPSLSSLENYSHEQTPAPVPPGWAPPAPPPPPQRPR